MAPLCRTGHDGAGAARSPDPLIRQAPMSPLFCLRASACLRGTCWTVAELSAGQETAPLRAVNPGLADRGTCRAERGAARASFLSNSNGSSRRHHALPRRPPPPAALPVKRGPGRYPFLDEAHPDRIAAEAPSAPPARLGIAATLGRSAAAAPPWVASCSMLPAGKSLQRRQGRHREVAAEVAEPTASTSTPQGRPTPTLHLGPDVGRRARAKHLYRIARIDPGARSRVSAVLESIDNGKPIKESRDVDVPQVAANFFYYAGWADKLEYPGATAAPRSASPARSSRGTSRC